MTRLRRTAIEYRHSFTLRGEFQRAPSQFLPLVTVVADSNRALPAAGDDWPPRRGARVADAAAAAATVVDGSAHGELFLAHGALFQLGVRRPVGRPR